MATDLYKKTDSCLNLYSVEEDTVDGVDFRKEMRDFLHTENRGEDMIYRRVKFENGIPKRCECTKTSRSQEANKDIPCLNCSGLGYYYNDIIARTYMNHSQAYSIHKRFKAEGEQQIEYRTVYFEWDFLKNSINDGDNIPNRFDRLIELNKDLSGNISSPTKEREVYEFLSVDPYRLDNSGRIEYYRCRIISVIDKSFLV